MMMQEFLLAVCVILAGFGFGKLIAAAVLAYRSRRK